MSITLFISILYTEAQVSSQFQINVVYADLPPFIFTQADGTVDGIIPLQLRQGKKICNSTGNINYVSKLNSLNKLQQISFSKRASCENDSLQNPSKLDVFLSPFVTSFRRKPVQICEEHVIHEQKFELIKTTKIAVIVHRNHILLTTKVFHSLSDIANILFFDTIVGVIFTVLLLFFDNVSHIRAGVSPKYIFIYYWTTYVTATSVGYGKRVPSTKISKFIDMFLMMAGMIMVCINTALISCSILGDFHFHLENENIAVLKNSHESIIVRNNYPKSIIKEFETYESVINAVSTQNFYVGFLNADYACWIQNHVLKEQKVHIVQMLDYEVSVNGVVCVNDSNIAGFYNCLLKRRQEILLPPTEYFRRTCDVDVVYYDNVLAFLVDSLPIQIFGTITLGLILYGVATEILIVAKYYKRKRSQDVTVIRSDNKDNGYIKNTEDNESSETDNAHRNMDVLCSDIQKIKADIMTISLKKSKFVLKQSF